LAAVAALLSAAVVINTLLVNIKHFAVEVQVVTHPKRYPAEDSDMLLLELPVDHPPILPLLSCIFSCWHVELYCEL
jgi:hypothetical protein